ncbi:MAG: DMT family transporter [Acidimicrobiia bacterium]|nr:DMT family transporter [Acidimicrobiia bacterium]
MTGGTILAAGTALDSAEEWQSAVLSVVAAAVYVAGMALQQRGNLQVMERAAAAGEDRSGRKVLTNLVWWAGMATMAAGFALHAVALGFGSLVVVQPLQVTQVMFMVPASAWVAHTAIRRNDWLAASAVAVGLALFLLAGRPGEGGSVDVGEGSWLIVAAASALGATVLAVASRWVPTYAAALLGTATGVIYGLQGAILKQATGQVGDASLAEVATWWAIPAVVAVNLCALVGQNLALRAGRLSSALATIAVATPVVSAAIGLWLFGETLHTAPLSLAGMAVGIALTVVGVSRLAASPSLLAIETDVEEDAAVDATGPEAN